MVKDIFKNLVDLLKEKKIFGDQKIIKEWKKIYIILGSEREDNYIKKRRKKLLLFGGEGAPAAGEKASVEFDHFERVNLTLIYQNILLLSVN